MVGDFVLEKEKAALVDVPDVTDDLPLVDDVPEDEEDDMADPNSKDKLAHLKKSKHHGINLIEELLITVTAANISKFTFDDVIFPIVGFRSRLPENEELKKIMFDVMAEDGITMDHFERQSLVDATSAWGSYRKIVAKAD